MFEPTPEKPLMPSEKMPAQAIKEAGEVKPEAALEIPAEPLKPADEEQIEAVRQELNQDASAEKPTVKLNIEEGGENPSTQGTPEVKQESWLDRIIKAVRGE